MASGTFLTLLDDIATLLDDVAAMSKIATKKTASVLSDDLAVNAEQVSGVNAARELPVIYKVFKGSLINKLILVPLALLMSAYASWSIVPCLIIGALYLCYEGFEKVYHKMVDTPEVKEAHHQELLSAVKNPEVNMVEFESAKIKSAVRTDFILSAEIVVITLGVIAASPFKTQLMVLTVMSIMVTGFVYGLVAAIVKIDDLGFYLQKKSSAALQRLGQMLIDVTPYIMKALGIFGTIAMFLVGGGIITHNIAWIHHTVASLGASGFGLTLLNVGVDMTVGFIAGAIVLLVVNVLGKMKDKISGHAHKH